MKQLVLSRMLYVITRKSQPGPNWSPVTKIMTMISLYFVITPAGSHGALMDHCSCCLLTSGIDGAVHYYVGLQICTILSTDFHLIT